MAFFVQFRLFKVETAFCHFVLLKPPYCFWGCLSNNSKVCLELWDHSVWTCRPKAVHKTLANTQNWIFFLDCPCPIWIFSGLLLVSHFCHFFFSIFFFWKLSNWCVINQTRHDWPPWSARFQTDSRPGSLELDQLSAILNILNIQSTHEKLNIEITQCKADKIVNWANRNICYM